MAGHSPSKTGVSALMSRPTPAHSAHIVAPIRLAQIQLSNSQRSACRACPVCTKASVIARILSSPGQAVVPSVPRHKRGGGAPSGAASLSVRASLPMHGASRRATRGVLTAAPGRAFGSALGVPFGPLLPPPSTGETADLLGRPSRPPSASSSQGAVVPPGGAPAPPGWGRSVRLPRAGAASGPTIMTPHESALGGPDEC